eukprot:CAMPEP_0113645084 /NCGR_PEP_ID=MMETSP0017_2-20120614/23741_1 /TAXON_ID=2856 /ORGANISM="Cylindrotheca closterium" /LENGTH=553 /DNA_ID=CAMNT_0000556755 /DNA_START=80 /DNA_END=1741 /DNA_ORIENTATION=- /assembly_acc=CAM_ASM_000147
MTDSDKAFAKAQSSLSAFLDSQQQKHKQNRGHSAYLESQRKLQQELHKVFVLEDLEDGTRVRRFRRVRKVKRRDKRASKAHPQASAKQGSLLCKADEVIASPYRKMLAVGVPDGAVKQKMLYDGVSKRIAGPVIARDYKPFICSSDGVWVRKVMRIKPKQPTTMASLTGSVSSSADLKPNDIAAPYKKLLKMGIMPLGAVKQKMILDGVSRDVIDLIESTEEKASAPLPPSPIAKEVVGKYHKMLKMGIPIGAVRMKMTIDRVAQEIQDSVAPVPSVTTVVVPPAVQQTTALDRVERRSTRGHPDDGIDAIQACRLLQQGRGGRGGRGGLLEAIEGRGSGRLTKRDSTSSMDHILGKLSLAGDGFDDSKLRELIQKVHEIEERQKRCEVQLTRMSRMGGRGCGRGGGQRRISAGRGRGGRSSGSGRGGLLAAIAARTAGRGQSSGGCGRGRGRGGRSSGSGRGGLLAAIAARTAGRGQPGGGCGRGSLIAAIAARGHGRGGRARGGRIGGRGRLLSTIATMSAIGKMKERQRRAMIAHQCASAVIGGGHRTLV